MVRITNNYVEERIDHVTGEVVSCTKRYTYKTKVKRFAMIQLDKKWYVGLKGCDVLILMEMVSIDNQQTMRVNVDKSVRQSICKLLDISEAQITKSLANMVKQNIIKRVSKGVYMINPDTVCMGNANTQLEKKEIYDNL